MFSKSLCDFLEVVVHQEIFSVKLGKRVLLLVPPKHLVNEAILHGVCFWIMPSTILSKGIILASALAEMGVTYQFNCL